MLGEADPTRSPEKILVAPGATKTSGRSYSVQPDDTGTLTVCPLKTAATARRLFSTLRAALNAAGREKPIPDNPAGGGWVDAGPARGVPVRHRTPPTSRGCSSKIYEGTNQIQSMVMARQLLKGDGGALNCGY